TAVSWVFDPPGGVRRALSGHTALAEAFTVAPSMTTEVPPPDPKVTTSGPDRGAKDHGGQGRAVETGAEWLDPLVSRIIAHAGATIGLLYLLEQDGRVLQLTTVLGVNPDIIGYWKRVPTRASAPLTDALREHRLI